jgi:hypothetical protein
VEAERSQSDASEAVFASTPPQPQIQAIAGRQGDGPLCVYARVRPDLKIQANQTFAHHAVFLLDTSLSEHPDRFAVNVNLLRNEDFALPDQEIAGTLLHDNEVPKAYLTARDADLRNAETYLVEAQRRLTAGDADGALRALSSIVEEHPTRGDALRLVGYRLVDMK